MNTVIAYIVIILNFIGLISALILLAKSRRSSSFFFLIAFVAVCFSYALGWLVVDYTIDPSTSEVTYTPFFYLKQMLLVLFHAGIVAGIVFFIRELKQKEKETNA